MFSIEELIIVVLIILGIIVSIFTKRWIYFGIFLITAIIMLPMLGGFSIIQCFSIGFLLMLLFKYVDKIQTKKRLEKEARKKNYYESDYYKQTQNDYVNITRNEKGKYGGYLVFDDLRVLEEKGTIFIFNAYIPKKDGTTSEVDVIIIDKSGIYVVESKNYGGWIFGEVNSKLWMQAFKSGQKNQFYNPIWQNDTHCKYLKSFLNIKSDDITSYIVFSNRCEFKKKPEDTQYYKIIYRNQLMDSIIDDINNKGIRFTEDNINDFYNKLYPLTQADVNIKQKHIEDIKRKNL